MKTKVNSSWVNVFLVSIGTYLVLCITSCTKPQVNSISLDTLPRWTSSAWMKELPSSLSLAQISIPGTHESNALHGCNFEIRVPIIGVQTSDLWRCQDVPIQQQLAMGVRYLDIRCRRVGDEFKIYHGPINQRLDFQNVLDICRSFLRINPSETIILKVQEEQVEFMPHEGTDSFVNIFIGYCRQYSNLFYKPSDPTARVIPTLGEARGKIVFLKRFESSIYQLPYGMKIAIGENTTSTSNLSSSEQLRVQDFYKPTDAMEKAGYFLPLLEESFGKSSKATTLYLNHTSAYQQYIIPLLEKKIPVPYYKGIADSMGEHLIGALKNKGKGNTGIVAMDFVKPSYCDAIIETNVAIGRKR